MTLIVSLFIAISFMFQSACATINAPAKEAKEFLNCVEVQDFEAAEEYIVPGTVQQFRELVEKYEGHFGTFRLSYTEEQEDGSWWVSGQIEEPDPNAVDYMNAVSIDLVFEKTEDGWMITSVEDSLG